MPMFTTLIDISVPTLLVWLACHFVGDFAFQSTWMSVEKGKSWEVNFYHCATYTAVFVLFAHASILAAAILFGTHFVVDPLALVLWKSLSNSSDWDSRSAYG